MTHELKRRDVLRGGAAGIVALALPEWAFPALAQGEELVEFTDYPEDWKTARGPEVRFYDIRKIDGPITPANEFYTVQHHGHPEIDVASFRVKVSGLVDSAKELSLDDMKALGETELVAGYECSGNSARAMQALASNARWSGVPLSKVLAHVGVKKSAREVVFFGADSGTEEVEFRGHKYDVEQQYGRSMSVDEVAHSEPFLATGMNGKPLTIFQGSPVRLVVPGWYGAPNVKWLANIHLQRDPYLGKYQARWYRTLRGQMVGGEMKWTENAITHSVSNRSSRAYPVVETRSRSSASC
jgi:DMSO/TMAO reductase YedYZ molybdopterin-dependent catalytic subunit